jgi:hypothetical protein
MVFFRCAIATSKHISDEYGIAEAFLERRTSNETNDV